MVLPMPRPVRVPGSRYPYAVKTVPKALRAVVGKTKLMRPLRAETAAEVQRLHREAHDEFDRVLANARLRLSSAPVRVPDREIDAVVGEWYRAYVTAHAEDPGRATDWEFKKERLLDADPDVRPEDDLQDYPAPSAQMAEARALWADRGITADSDTMRRTAQRLWLASIRAAETLARRAGGDWTADDYGPLYPLAAPPNQAPAPSPAAPTAPSHSFASLVAARAAEEQTIPKTRHKWDATFRNLAAAIGHDDPSRVTKADVLRWKQARFEEGRHHKTVNDGIGICRAVFNWAKKNGLLSGENPFSGTEVRVRSSSEPARKPYEPDQARTILLAARKEGSGWRRWLPWLLAFSGARLAELADMRREDVRQEDGVWVLDIRPFTDRRLKSGHSQRMVPIHRALVQEGFLDYLAGLPAAGPLFPDMGTASDGTRGTWATKAHSRWLKRATGIVDAALSPAHSWRHRMRDAAVRIRMPDEARDAILGHDNASNAGAGYGKGYRGMPDELRKELDRIPSPLD